MKKAKGKSKKAEDEIRRLPFGFFPVTFYFLLFHLLLFPSTALMKKANGKSKKAEH